MEDIDTSSLVRVISTIRDRHLYCPWLQNLGKVKAASTLLANDATQDRSQRPAPPMTTVGLPCFLDGPRHIPFHVPGLFGVRI